MITRVIKTNEAEAEKILSNKVRFIFRNINEPYKVGDIVQFLVYKDKRPVLSRINSKKYVVTAVLDNGDAPINEGFLLVGFREA